MFSISFGEILLIATIGLVVIGPKRLPKAARFAGHLFGRLQRQVQSVKADIKREMDAADLQSVQKEYQQAQNSAGDIYQSIRQTASDAATDIAKVSDDAKGGGDDNDDKADNKSAKDNNNNIFPPPHTAPTMTSATTNAADKP